MHSNHFLDAAKVRPRLCAHNTTCKSVHRRFDIQKLRSQKITESLSIRLSELLHDAPPDPGVNTQWQHSAHSLHTAAAAEKGWIS